MEAGRLRRRRQSLVVMANRSSAEYWSAHQETAFRPRQVPPTERGEPEGPLPDFEQRSTSQEPEWLALPTLLPWPFQLSR